MSICNYEPQVSPGNPDVIPMPTSAPVVLQHRGTILLEFPYDTPTVSLELRNPEFNDKLVKKYTRLYRKSRGNSLIVYRDPSWPKVDILNWSFRGLTSMEAEAALDFFKQSLGKYIKVTTYESLIYKGIILNPDNPISDELPELSNQDDFDVDDRPVSAGFTLKFDFQGTRIS